MTDPIKALGGVRPTARAPGVPVSTVHNWTKNGIPAWRRGALDEAVRIREGFVDLTAGRQVG